MPEEKIFIDADDSQYEARVTKELIRVLIFSLAKEYYAIELASAKQVAYLGSVTRVPTAPAFIRGITNLGGQIIPLVDISFLLGVAPLDMAKYLKYIVIESGQNLFGILVDQIEGAAELEKSALQPPLATLKAKLLEFTIGEIEFKTRVLVMLDLKKILNSSEFNNF